MIVLQLVVVHTFKFLIYFCC